MYYTRLPKKKKKERKTEIRMFLWLDLLRHGTGKSLCLSVYRCLLELPFIFAFPDSLLHISLFPYKQKNREPARGDLRGKRAQVLWDCSGGFFWSYANEETFGTTNLTVTSIYPLNDSSPPTLSCLLPIRKETSVQGRRVGMKPCGRCWWEVRVDQTADVKLDAGLWPEKCPTYSL